MFEFIRFAIRNPGYVTRNARAAWATRTAMKTFSEQPENRECAWCGRKGSLEVHHIHPVSVAPDKAADPGNMIMLCRKPACHLVIGHDGDFGGRFVENVKAICRDSAQRVVKIKGKDGGG